MSKFKYPSTPRLRNSQSVSNDDSLVSDAGLSRLQSGAELVVTEKMDGGNVSLYRDDFHARSLDARSQPWDARSMAKWVRANHVRTTADWRSRNDYELNTIKKETA